MKKYIKKGLLFICVLSVLFCMNGCQRNSDKKSYLYGVISFSAVNGENVCLVYVPADYCGYVRIHLEVDYITYPEDLRDGDLVKMTFSALQIRQGAYNQFFDPSPTKVEILGRGVNIEEEGKNYRLIFPAEKVEGLGSNSTIIDLYADNSLICSLKDFVLDGDDISVLVAENQIFSVLANYEGHFIAQ